MRPLSQRVLRSELRLLPALLIKCRVEEFFWSVSRFYLNRLWHEVFFEVDIGNSQVFRTLFTVRGSIRTQLSPYLIRQSCS